MRSLSSSRDPTRMWRSICLAILPKKPSMTLSHEPWVGVSTISNLPGCPSSQALVSLDLCTEWLSSTSLMTCPFGYLASRASSSSTNSRLLWRSRTTPSTVPSCRSMPASSAGVPRLRYSWSRVTAPPRTPGVGLRSSPVGESAWMPGFSSTETTRASGPSSSHGSRLPSSSKRNESCW